MVGVSFKKIPIFQVIFLLYFLISSVLKIASDNVFKKDVHNKMCLCVDEILQDEWTIWANMVRV